MFCQPHLSVDLLVVLEIKYGVRSFDNALWIREAASFSHSHPMVSAKRAGFPATADGHSLGEEGFVDKVIVVLKLVSDVDLPWLG